MSQIPFQYIDHVADTRFIAYGSTLENVFENAAAAMLFVIADTAEVQPITEFDIEIETIDLKNLMVDFLSELLFLFDAEETVLKEAAVTKIEVIRDRGEEKWKLTATTAGAPIDAVGPIFKTEVKAVTYNHIRVEKMNGGYEAEVVLDL